MNYETLHLYPYILAFLKKTTNIRLITYGIYGIFFVIFVGIWIWEAAKFKEVLTLMFPWEERYDFANIIYSFKLTNLFSASVLSLALGLGIFIKNRIGWILITGWFYFFCLNYIKLLFEEKNESIGMLLQNLSIIGIPILCIVLMNTFSGILEYHRLDDGNKLKLNFWGIGVGLVLGLLLIVKKTVLQQWL